MDAEQLILRRVTRQVAARAARTAPAREPYPLTSLALDPGGRGPSTALAALDPLSRGRVIRDIQARAGNAAVQRLVRARPAAVLRQPAAGPPAVAPTAAPKSPGADPTASGPAIDQAKLGEEEYKLGNWTLFNAEKIDKRWPESGPLTLAHLTLFGAGRLQIPGIDELKAKLGLFASVSAHANFFAGYGPGELRNLRVGMSRRQATLLQVALLAGGPVLATIAAYLGKFTARGELVVPVKIRAGVGIAGALEVGAGLSNLEAVLEAGLEADAIAEISPTIKQEVSFYWDNGRLHVERDFSINDALDLEFQLNAFIAARLFNIFSWEKRWSLTRTLIDQWPVRAVLGLHGDPDEAPDPRSLSPNVALLRPGKYVKFTLEEGKMDAGSLISKTFSKSIGDKDKVTKGASGGGRPGAGGPGSHRAPTGDRNDPITMAWTKPLYRYRNPVWLDTPNQPGREPFYRDKPKALPDGREIGALRWPGVGGEPLQKLDRTPRGGVEGEFKKALEDQGFEDWDDLSPDHVVDVGWGGTDTFSNLWPLDRRTNRESGPWHNWKQEVEYNYPSDPPDHPPRRSNLGDPMLIGRFFRIREVADPPQ